MKVAWTRRARSNLDGIFNYILVRDPMAAFRVLDAIKSRVELLDDQPALGRPGKIEGTRELVVSGTPYVVGYRIEKSRDSITILAVLHGAQLWPKDLG